jgi:hypothetical protein
MFNFTEGIVCNDIWSSSLVLPDSITQDLKCCSVSRQDSKASSKDEKITFSKAASERS